MFCYCAEAINTNGARTSQRASAEYGVSSDGLATTVQPAAIAGADFLVSIAIGKFHCKQDTSRRIFTNVKHLLQHMTTYGT